MSQSEPIVVHSEPRQVYRAMLHPESLARWWGCTAVIDAREGGAWVGGWGEGEDGLGQQTVIWAHLSRLVPDSAVTLKIGDTEIAIQIEAHPQGSAVSIDQINFPASSEEEEQAALQSWVAMVQSLKVWIEKEHPFEPAAGAAPPPQPAAPKPQPAPEPAPTAQPSPQPARAQPKPAPSQAAQPQATPQPQPASQPAPQPTPAKPSPGPQAAAQPKPAPAPGGGDAPSDPYGAAEAMAEGGARVLDDGGFGVTDPNAVVKSWAKEQGFGYVTHPQLGDVVFDYDGCDFEPEPGDKVLLLVIAKAWNGKPKVKRIACPAKGSKLDK